MEQERHTPVPLSMAAEERPSLAPVPASARVWWREFRIQVLPVLTFVGSLVLAGLLWHEAVLPISVPADPPAPSAHGSIQAHPNLQQASHSHTNGISKTPAVAE